MSHVATISLEIMDLDALKAACESLGLELCKNVRQYRWYGRSVGDSKLPEGFTKEDLGKCEHVIRVKGPHSTNSQAPYEIGLVTRRDGRPGFCMMWDTWQGGYGLVEKVGGEQCDKLRQEYAIETATRIAKRQGFRVVKKSIRHDGSVVLVTQKG